MEQQFTVKEVIDFSAKDLNSLSIPVELIPTIGMTISRVAQNLEACSKAITANDVKKDDDFEIVEAGSTNQLPADAAIANTEGGEINV